MGWIRTTVREIVGLFVDDGSFALAIVVWVVLALAVVRHGGSPAPWQGPVLFAGLAAILVESVMRAAGRKK
jgi:hypothetical protein